MKKKIKTQKQLSKIKKVESVVKSRPKKVEPEQKPEKTEVEDNSRLAQSFDNAAKTNLMLLSSLKEQIAHLQKGSKVTEWDFEIIRDSSGHLKQVKARAVG